MTETRHVKFDIGRTSCLKQIHVVGRTITASQYTCQNILSLEIIGICVSVTGLFAFLKERN